jgi:hypothetical protein
LSAGKAAEERLVLSHLRLAAHCARLSLNIRPPQRKPGNQQPANIDNDDNIAKQQFATIKTFGDITRLRSAYGNLDDRIQVANLALLDAASSYRPVLLKNNKLLTFTSHATW